LSATSQLPIWDRFVRAFHWALVLSICGSYATVLLRADELHSWVGYFLLILVSARIVWGFIGPRHARFSDFLYHPSHILEYTRDVINWRGPERYLGHNPAAGLVALVQILLLFAVTLIGVVVLGAVEFSGPLWSVFGFLGDNTVSNYRALHRIGADIILVLIGIHLLGVAITSLLHKENLVAAMIHGHKKK
jgi:cytochrome b